MCWVSRGSASGCRLPPAAVATEELHRFIPLRYCTSIGDFQRGDESSVYARPEPHGTRPLRFYHERGMHVIRLIRFDSFNT